MNSNFAKDIHLKQSHEKGNTAGSLFCKSFAFKLLSLNNEMNEYEESFSIRTISLRQFFKLSEESSMKVYRNNNDLAESLHSAGISRNSLLLKDREARISLRNNSFTYGGFNFREITKNLSEEDLSQSNVQEDELIFTSKKDTTNSQKQDEPPSKSEDKVNEHEYKTKNFILFSEDIKSFPNCVEKSVIIQKYHSLRRAWIKTHIVKENNNIYFLDSVSWTKTLLETKHASSDINFDDIEKKLPKDCHDQMKEEINFLFAKELFSSLQSEQGCSTNLINQNIHIGAKLFFLISKLPQKQVKTTKLYFGRLKDLSLTEQQNALNHGDFVPLKDWALEHLCPEPINLITRPITRKENISLTGELQREFSRMMNHKKYSKFSSTLKTKGELINFKGRKSLSCETQRTLSELMYPSESRASNTNLIVCSGYIFRNNFMKNINVTRDMLTRACEMSPGRENTEKKPKRNSDRILTYLRFVYRSLMKINKFPSGKKKDPLKLKNIIKDRKIELEEFIKVNKSKRNDEEIEELKCLATGLSTLLETEDHDLITIFYEYEKNLIQIGKELEGLNSVFENKKALQSLKQIVKSATDVGKINMAKSFIKLCQALLPFQEGKFLFHQPLRENSLFIRWLLKSEKLNIENRILFFSFKERAEILKKLVKTEEELNLKEKIEIELNYQMIQENEGFSLNQIPNRFTDHEIRNGKNGFSNFSPTKQISYDKKLKEDFQSILVLDGKETCAGSSPGSDSHGFALPNQLTFSQNFNSDFIDNNKQNSTRNADSFGISVQNMTYCNLKESNNSSLNGKRTNKFYKELSNDNKPIKKIKPSEIILENAET